MARDQAARTTPYPTTLVDGTNTTATVILNTYQKRALSLLWTWTSTLVATPVLEFSLNYDPRNPDTARWTPDTDPGRTAFLALAGPSGGKPAGVAGSALMQIAPLYAAAVRFTITRTGSSGNVTVDMVGE